LKLESRTHDGAADTTLDNFYKYPVLYFSLSIFFFFSESYSKQLISKPVIIYFLSLKMFGKTRFSPLWISLMGDKSLNLRPIDFELCSLILITLYNVKNFRSVEMLSVSGLVSRICSGCRTTAPKIFAWLSFTVS
jgi:hypothetical protein